MEQNFILRPFVMEDLNDLVGFANNPKIACWLTDMYPHPYGMKDGIAFINMTLKKDPREILAIDIEGKVSGAIGLHPQIDIHRRNAELGYWLAEPFWGKGIMTGAIKQMVKYGFDNFDMERIFARPFGDNLSSQRVLEKAGFKFEARFPQTLIKNNKVQDEIFYSIRRKN